MEQTIKVVIISIAVFAIGTIALQTVAKHDAEVMEAGDQYIACIVDQYGQTPANFYGHFGYYPNCK